MTGRAAAVIVAIRDALARVDIEGLTRDERRDVVDALVMDLARAASVEHVDPDADLASVIERAWFQMFGEPTPCAKRDLAKIRGG